jgi:ribosome-binding protein aMBF1 (putative translation factor)
MLFQICQCCGSEAPALKNVVNESGTSQSVCPTCAMRIINEKTSNESQLLRG